MGLSQPQISRIIKKIEENVGFPLLDRSSKRTSYWLPEALKLAEIHAQQTKSFEREIQLLRMTGVPSTLRVGLLEGMMVSLFSLIEDLTRKLDVLHLEVVVLDLSDLEEKFFRGEIDLLFSSQEPGKRKFEHSLILGYQRLDILNKNARDRVMSPFEFASDPGKRKSASSSAQRTRSSSEGGRSQTKRVVLSNSLEWRKMWIKKFGAEGQLPSEIQSKRTEQAVPVIALGADYPWMELFFTQLRKSAKIKLGIDG